VQEYPDAEIVAIVGAASSITGLSVSAVLEDFGEFIAPALIKMFGHLLWAEWKTIDVIENTEGTVHSVVRVKPENLVPRQGQSGATPSDSKKPGHAFFQHHDAVFDARRLRLFL
jgi:hypothetical protein